MYPYVGVQPLNVKYLECRISQNGAHGDNLCPLQTEISQLSHLKCIEVVQASDSMTASM